MNFSLPCHNSTVSLFCHLQFFRIKGGGHRGWWFAVSSCSWNGLTVFSRKNDGFMVPLFVSVSKFLHESVIQEVKLSQKMKMKATNNCPVRYNFANILLLFTLSSGLKSKELAFPF